MASERAPQVWCAAASVAGVDGAGGRRRHVGHDSPRLPCMCACWPRCPGAGSAVALPGAAGAAAAAPLAPPPGRRSKQQALLDNALALEARLEHAPVALFRIDGGRRGQPWRRSTPTRANCVAPGRASDPAGLYASWRRSRPNGAQLVASTPSAAPSARWWRCPALTMQGRPQRLAALMPVEKRARSRGPERLAPAGARADPRDHEFADAGGLAVAHGLWPAGRSGAALRPTSACRPGHRAGRDPRAAPTAWSTSSAATAACRTCRRRSRTVRWRRCSSACRAGGPAWRARGGERPRSRWSRPRWN
jgi:hypothetical protein